MDVLSDLMWQGIQYAISHFFNECFSALSGGMVSTMSVAQELLDSVFVTNTIHTTQIIAGMLLTIMICVESLQTYILHSHGEPSDPGGLLIRVAMAAATITSVPWIITTVYKWGTEVAMAIADVQSLQAADIEPFTAILSTTGASIAMLLAGIIAFFIWCLILVQTGIRAVELAFLAVAGPIMSIGLISQSKGLFGTWWKEVIVISLSQATQVFLIKGAVVSLTLYTFDGIIQWLFFIGWLWVAYKSPSVLRQFAYSTGMGGAAGGVVQQGGTLVIMKRMMTKGVA